MLRIAANDVIIRHDALWPRGLNELLYVQTPLEVAELRLSCLRHRWPPVDADMRPGETQVNLPRLRARLQRQVVGQSSSGGAASGATATTKAAAGAPRAGAARPSSKSTTQPTSPTKTAQQSTKSGLPSPINRRPATATKSPTSPTKTPRSRPQSAPKPSPAASTSSSRPAQPAASTPLARRSQPAAKSTTSVSRPSDRSPAAGPAAAASECTSTSSVNGATSSPHYDNDTTAASTAERADLGISTTLNAPSDGAATVGCPQVPAVV